MERGRTWKVSYADMKSIRRKGSEENGGYLWEMIDFPHSLHRQEIDPITGLSLPAVEQFHNTNQ